jgi:hypothetical protein
MVMKRLIRNCVLSLLILVSSVSFGQNVPLGIFYQAVARDNFGKELANRVIDVRFSIISGNPLGTVVYQELHSAKPTSKYGVFSLIIGKGTPTGGITAELSQVNWSEAYHYLKVEVKFDNDFLDMGTMQFLAVPYALFAQKSLEPGPRGPKGETGLQGQQGVPGLKGDQGNPATDDQTLSFNGNNLTISGGNTVNLSNLNIPHQLSILGDTLSIMGGNKVSLTNQIQDLQLDVNNKLKISKNASATVIDLTRFLDDKQQLGFNNSTNVLSVSGGNEVDLTPMKQDLLLTGNTLTITNRLSPTAVDLSKYMQQLIFTPADNKLQIVGGNTIDLTSLKNDADADPTNELQSLTYNKNTGDLAISSRNTVNLINSIGFKAKKSISQTGLTSGSTYPFVNSEVEFNEGSFYDPVAGSFTAPMSGIYTFYISYKADGAGSARILNLIKNGSVYEVLGPDISSGTEIIKWITMKLDQGNVVSLTINTGMSTYSGTGSFLGYKVN